jgi:tetratricopeptide (TPR) repeat protein
MRTAVALVFAVMLSTAAQDRDPEFLVRQGRGLVSQGKHDEADRLFRQALKINPRSFEASLALGIVQDLMGQYAEARTHFQRAADVAREVGAPVLRNQALNAMAFSWAFEGEGQRSLAVLQTVRQQQMNDGDVLGAAATARTAGRLLLETGDVENGRTWYERGYEESKPPESAVDNDKLLWEMRLRHARARIACKAGNVAEARRQLAAFEELMRRRNRQADDNELYRWVAGHVALYAKDYDTAIAQLSRGNLQDPFVLDLLGRAYEGKGDMANARRYYERTMALNVHNLQTPLARPHARARLAAIQ